ncbi:MAG TPA: hypothetical protein VNM89_04145 [Solirubrobacterales bacterium]|nr:hypothetical protein [Solirubrobacterales bacterium]
MSVAFLAVGMTSAARADTGDIIAPQNDPHTPADGWQAGTCTSDVPECSVNTPDQFFRQAAGHPPVGFTQFIIKSEDGPLGSQVPVGNLKTVRVDLPVGLSVNPQATEQCDLGPGERPDARTCPPGSKVGTSTVTAVNPDTGFSLTLSPADVFNLVPRQGQPARFGLSILGNDAFLEAGVVWEGDYHEHFTIDVARIELPGIPGLETARIAKNRLVFDGRAGDGTFITTPSTCHNPEVPPFVGVYSTLLRAESYELPNPTFPEGSSFWESPLPPGEMPERCDLVDLEGSSIGVDPQTAEADSPSGPAVNVDVPHIPGGDRIAKSNVKDAHVTLPPGMGLNPSAANGLEACTDAQLGKGTRNPVACPAASRIGAVTIQTPPLPPDSLTGNVYLGQQLSRDPASGQAFRIFVVAESDRYGISARLIGNVSADPRTGQLTTTFADNPQVPFSSFRVDFDDGPRAPLSSPPVCGPHDATVQLDPWSGSPSTVSSSGFTLTSAPGGGDCARTLAERPFDPGFAAATASPKARAFTPLHVDIARSDGNQELKGVNVDLPPGLTAKLAGVRYCPEATIAAAAANGGLAEKAQPSCPDSSLIGSVAIATGTGSEPLKIEGKAYLSGPFNGAPLSLAVVTPATAGPFDLGSVVVRVALFVDPKTAQVRAVSDPIPHVFGGVLLGVRSIAVRIDRRQFSLNPTNCAPLAFGGALRGGGGDPNDPAAFTVRPVTAPFQVRGCEELAFRPRLHMRLFGGMKRAKHPKLRAVLRAREGDANIGRAAVTLPRTLFLDQASLAQICTRPQYAAGACPKESIYGFARAVTPLLDAPLQGPVYLRSSDNLLPDLVASLRGQVNIELAGRIDTGKNGGIRNTFDALPDVPVSRFILTMRGGKRGLLVNSVNQCRKRTRVIARFRGQNGKKANQRPKLRTPCRRRSPS